MQSNKRGWLSNMDLLPDEARPFVKKARKELGENNRTAEDIRAELNAHLAKLGFNPISKSAFHRESLSIAETVKDMARVRQMAAIFAAEEIDMPEGDVGMLISEMCKLIIYEVVEKHSVGDESMSPKMVKDISLALERLEKSAQISTKRRHEIEAKRDQKAAAAVDVVAKEKGLSDELAEAIKAKVLGIKKD